MLIVETYDIVRLQDDGRYFKEIVFFSDLHNKHYTIKFTNSEEEAQGFETREQLLKMFRNQTWIFEEEGLKSKTIDI